MIRRRHLRVAWPLAAAVLAAACVASSRPGASHGPAAPTAPTAIWTVSGDTASRVLHDTTYFTDPGSPTLHAGEASVVWQCAGAGQLEIALVAVAKRGPVVPDLTSSIARIVVPCPTAAAEGTAAIRAFPRGVVGNENAIVVRPATEPSGPIRYTVMVVQGS